MKALKASLGKAGSISRRIVMSVKLKKNKILNFFVHSAGLI